MNEDRVLLVNLPDPGAVIPPIGLWSLKANWPAPVEIIDFNLVPEESRGPVLQRWTEIHRSETLGLSARFSIQHDDLLEWAEWGRKRDLRIIAGGPHAAFFGDIPGVDEVVSGPGEGTDPVRLPVIPTPALELYWAVGKPHNGQSASSRWVPIETSRGCNHRCGYCGMQAYWGRWHPLEVESQLREYASAGIEEVFIEDDNVATDKDHLYRVLGLLQDLSLWWSAPNGFPVRKLLDDEVFRAVAESPCWRLSLPFETGSRRTANLMKTRWKYIPFHTAKDLVHRLRTAGIRTAGFFIIGYPGETRDDIHHTLEYANSLPLDDRYIYVVTPYPGTPLYDLCRERGYLTMDGEALYRNFSYTKSVITTPWLSAEEVDEIRRKDRNRKVMK